MPTFNYSRVIIKIVKASCLILICMLGLLWLNQQSLDRYWVQHFHRDSPWGNISSPAWKQGAKIMTAAEAAKDAFVESLSEPPPAPAIPKRKPLPMLEYKPVFEREAVLASEHPKDLRQLSRWLTAERESDNMQPEGHPSDVLYDEEGYALLAPGKQVLFIGDSMMEGVAPRVLKRLKEEHQVNGINLSKRSTGLAYPGFFSWPEATASALEQHQDIGLLAVFLGPNDPWDMPVSKGQPYLRFGSAEWEEEYRARIRQILALAEKYSLPVIWVLPPNMRKEKLNQRMAVLSALYESEVNAAGGIALSVNALFGYQDTIYSPKALIDGKPVNVRASDGTHYSPAGLDVIAAAMMNNIHIMPLEQPEVESE